MGRPAEAITGTAALGALLALQLGVTSPDAQAAMIAGLGLVPASVTLLVTNGGVRGVLRKLWRGQDKSLPSPADGVSGIVSAPQPLPAPRAPAPPGPPVEPDPARPELRP